MDRMQLLDTLLAREVQRRDTAAVELQQAQAQTAAAKQQGMALLSYRDEYRQRWQAQFQRRATMDILRCYHGFVERLDQAIVAQQSNVALAERREAMARDRLLQRETRVAMVRKLMQRRQKTQTQQQERREQKSADEAAQRMGWAARQALLPA